MEGLDRLRGASAAMKRVRSTLARVAPTNLPVLLTGETGTGKEVAAQALHEASGRTGRFVAVDCGALSPQLVESELFGHERGAFTGASRRRDGLVHSADGGTFFLDEVGELPLDVQTRLLRLLQEGTYRPVGSQQSMRADIRVIAATLRDLEERVAEGAFRQDLYHRLAVVSIELPPLRARERDALDLFLHFLEVESRKAGRTPPKVPPDIAGHLATWPWPGNVREIVNVARYVGALCQEPRLDWHDLPPALTGPAPEVPDLLQAAPQAGLVQASVPIRTDLPYIDARRIWLDAFQDRYVDALLQAHDGNVSAAARAAGMDRRSIQRILSRREDPQS